MIRTLPEEPQHWEQVKTVLTHSDHLKTFGQIQSHLEMEEERLKMFRTPNVALVAKGNRPKATRTLEAASTREVRAPLRKVGRRLEWLRNKRPKAMDRQR